MYLFRHNFAMTYFKIIATFIIYYSIIYTNGQKLKDVLLFKKLGTRISELHEECSYPCHKSKHMLTFDLVMPFEEACPNPLNWNLELKQISNETSCNQNVMFLLL